MGEIEKYYNGEIHVDFDEEKIKITQPMFELGELESFDNYIHSIVEEYSKMKLHEKDQILTQRIIIKQEEEIEKLKSIIKEVREYITSQKLHKFQDTTGGLTFEERKLLEILDKENKDGER